MAREDKFSRLVITAFVVTGLSPCSNSGLAEDDIFSVQENPRPMQRCYWLSRQIPAEGLCGEKMRPDINILTQEAKNGNNIAAMRLGQLYRSGNWGIPLDLKKAVKWFHHGAKLGDRYSQLQLARAYEYGRMGVEQDIFLAVEYYKMATENGIYPDLEEKIEKLEKKLAKEK